MKNIVFVYSTNPSKDEAKRIARHLLDKKLIGCANIFEVAALYPWEGKLVDENEVVLIAKTTDDMFEATKQEIEKIHPFSVPCIVKIPVSANDTYAAWLVDNIKQQ